MITFKQEGDFKNLEKFLKRCNTVNIGQLLDKYGKEGVSVLASNTPVDTGETANSWDYEIVQNGSKWSIYWTNSNVVDGTVVAVIIQYGHGTKNGGYVEGRDYINPVMKPLFDKIANEAWKEVGKL